MIRKLLLTNIFLKTLRDQRGGLIGWGLGHAVLLLFTAGQYPEIIGTGPEREQNIADAVKMVKAFSVMGGGVTTMDTVGGYVTSRVYAPAALFLALWLVVVGVGLIRGEEESGALDVLLSTTRSRAAVVLHKAAALWALALLTMAIAWTGLWAGYEMAGADMPVGESLLALFNVSTMAAFWATLGLLAGQVFGSRRMASAVVGGALFGSYILNNVAEATPSLEWLSWLMPFHYFSMSKPLAAGYAMEWGAWALLLAASAGMAALAAVLFTRRDIGSIYSLFKARKEAKRGSTRRLTDRALLGSVYSRSLRDLVVPTLAWGFGLGMLAAVFVATANEALEPLRKLAASAGGNDSWMARLFGAMLTYEEYMSAGYFLYLQVLVAVYAVVQVAGWASDEEEGRLELMAAMPLPRGQTLLARYAAACASLLGILAITWSLIMGTAAMVNVSIDGGKIATGLLASVPLAMVVMAFGICLATWLRRPGSAVQISAGLVVAMFFLEVFGVALDFPEAVKNLSIFYLYGRPVAEGIKWGGTLALSTAALLLFSASLAGLARRDIAK